MNHRTNHQQTSYPDSMPENVDGSAKTKLDLCLWKEQFAIFVFTGYAFQMTTKSFQMEVSKNTLTGMIFKLKQILTLAGPTDRQVVYLVRALTDMFSWINLAPQLICKITFKTNPVTTGVEMYWGKFHSISSEHDINFLIMVFCDMEFMNKYLE